MRAAPIFALLLAACHRVVAIDAPPDDSGTRATIVAVVEADQIPVLLALDGAALPPINVHSDARIFVFSYRRSLAELFLEPGPIALETGAGPRRPIPAFDRGHEARAFSGSISAWTPIAALDASLADVRIRAVPFGECIAKSGCLTPVPGATDPECLVPCTTSAIEQPMPPAPPSLPSLVPCPPGWRAVDDGVELCLPPVRRACLQWIDSGECVASCPTGQWPDVPPGRLVIYVSPGDSIEDAIPLATPGTIIALAKGVYDGDLEITNDGVELRGACPEETTIGGRITARDDVGLRSLAIDGELFADLGTTVTATAIAARSVLAIGSRVTLQRVVVEGGLEATGEGASIDAGDAVIRGARVTTGGRIALERALIEGSTVDAHHAGSRITLRDTVLRNTRMMLAESGASIEASRTTISKSTYAAAGVFGGSLALADCVVTDTSTGVLAPGRTDVESNGIVAIGGSIRLDRVRFARLGSHVVRASDETGVEMHDVSVRSIRAMTTEAPAAAFFFTNAASAGGERIELDDFAQDQVLFAGEGTRATITDLFARSVEGGAGSGIQLNDDAFVELERAVLEKSSGIGVWSNGFSHVELRDVRIREHRTGMAVLESSTSSVSRVVVERSTGIAVCIDDDGSLDASHFVAEGSTGTAPPDIRCTLAEVGSGIAIGQHSALSMRGFAIRNHHATGIAIVVEQSLDLSDGVISGNTTGARLPSGFAPERRLLRVKFAENEENIEN